MSAAFDRIQRWAAALPISEPIPVTRDESYELAELLSKGFGGSKGKPIGVDVILKSLDDGSFKLYNHKVVIL